MRCAIYTRKSVESERQQFTSLDAQRLSAAAYVLSQAGNGWTAVPKLYGDLGYSGGDMRRPGLQSLLDDVRAGLVDCVVVYKVDRLSRKLTDFAQLVDLFDEHKTTFVSVTEQFNTTTPMGRLTLNMMLSFAQFERELVSEKTRDNLRERREAGRSYCSRLYGFANRQGKLVPVESEQLVLRDIQAQAKSGASYAGIAANLNKRRVQPPKGGRWRHSTISRILVRLAAQTADNLQT